MAEQHPQPEPIRATGAGAEPVVIVHCPTCQGMTRGAASYCAHCGESLLRPDESTCLGCGASLEAQADPHCAACGAYVPRRLRPVPARSMSHRSRLARLATAVVAAGGLWLVVQAGSQWFGAAGGAPSLAGVHVGDAQPSVERKLGKPERRDTEIYWNGPDGKAHRVIMWQYGVTKDGETAVADLSVTFLDGKVFQVGVLEKGFKTSEGLAVGDRVIKANRLYGTAIEEDMVAGLQPMKFLKGGVVVKIVTLPGDDHLLAIGIESPKSLPLDSAHEGDSGEPSPGSPQAEAPGGGGGGSLSLGDDIPSQPI